MNAAVTATLSVTAAEAGQPELQLLPGLHQQHEASHL
jgi:hypothetical protein